MKKTGRLSLEIRAKDGRSAPGKIYSMGALKVMRPQYLDDSGQVTYCVLNPGGAYLDGDRYEMEITLEANADLYLTTQSASKIYCTPTDKAVQESSIRLGEGSSLEYVPDPLIPYEDAIYEQRQSVFMTPTSSLFLSEMITPGWSRERKGFAYKDLSLGTKIYIDGEIKVVDGVSFTPAESSLESMGMLEGHSHFGSVLAVHRGITDALVEKLWDELTEAFPHTLIGLSVLGIAGFSLRLLAHDTATLERVITHCQNYYRQVCFQRAPIPMRKY